MTPEKLLVVDDDADNRDVLSRRLARRGYLVDVAGNGFEAMDKIRSAEYDLVLMDQRMPGLSGLDLLRLLRATYTASDLPIIMVTAAGQSQAMVDALDGGANDYVVEPVGVPEVAARIQAQLMRSKADKAVRETERRLIDPLTGLGQRRMLLDRLRALLQTGNRFALILVDLDGFKVLNSSFGRGAGDAVLVETAARLQAFAAGWNPSSITVGRAEGDQFALIFENSGAENCASGAEDCASGTENCASDVAAIARALLAHIPTPMRICGFEIVLSASLGVVADAPPGCTAEDLLRDAEIAMYRAKECGRNRWQVFEPALREHAKTRMAIVQDLRRAIELNQLEAYYQPKVNLKTRAILGFEALLRWRHPQRGLMAPAEFIPLAEETGLIVPIGEWILATACHQLKIWQKKFPSDPPLSMNVNLSVKQLADRSLVDRVCALLRETGIPPETLKLELTESSLIVDLESASDVLDHLQRLRVGLNLDDFGTGYFSLNYLRTLHFDSLKIDRSFVTRLSENSGSHAIVATIMNLARALDMGVVAEGIEETAQLDALVGMGCLIGQGFLFSKPVEAAVAEQQLESHRNASVNV